MALENSTNCYPMDFSYKHHFKNNKKIINKTCICTNLNGNYIQYKYEYNGLFYEHCANGYLKNNSIINNCNC